MFGIDDAIIASVGSNIMSNVFAGNRQEDQQSFNAQQYATRYQTQVKDMAAAGLNPMLSYMQSPGSAASSGIASASQSDVGQVVNQSKLTSAQVANIAADTQNKQASADLIAAQAAAAWSSARQATAQTDLIDRQSYKVGEEIELIKAQTGNTNMQTANLQTQGKVLEKTIESMQASIALMTQQSYTESAKRGQLTALADKIVSENKLIGLDIDAALKFANFGRDFSQVKPLLDILKAVIGRGR